MSDGCSTRIVATPVFVQQKQEFIMDNLKPLKSFLTDLITPIVQDAVTNAIPVNIKTKDKNPVVFYMLRGGIKRCVSAMHLL